MTDDEIREEAMNHLAVVLDIPAEILFGPSDVDRRSSCSTAKEAHRA